MAGNRDYQKRVNRALVLRELRRAPGTSRIALSGLLGLDRSTMTNIVNELREAGLVEITAAASDPPAGGGLK